MIKSLQMRSHPSGRFADQGKIGCRGHDLRWLPRYKNERTCRRHGTYIMEKILIDGGKPLVGEIETSGMKNAALPIIFGCVLVKGRCVIENLPEIDDVEVSFQILEDMGATIERIDRTTYAIDCTKVRGGS